MTERFYSPRDIANMFGVSYHAVLRAIERGDLEAERVFNRLRISADALASYRSAHRVKSRPAGRVRIGPTSAPPLRPRAAQAAADTAIGSVARLRAIEEQR